MNREELLAKWGEPVQVLDHGVVQLLDVMGGDQAVLQAARTSTSAASKGSEADRKLIRYLMRHRHATPFEACNIKLYVKLPIFAERQWVRHRAAWLNEVSARYTQLPEEVYVPDPAVRPMAQSKANRQGSAGGLGEAVESHFCVSLEASSLDAFGNYQLALDDGVAKEIARCFLPVNTYTAKVWGTSLRMALHFLGLRADPHAQWEIRQYAAVICDILQDWVPWTYEAFCDYQLNAHTFSAQEMGALQEVVSEWMTHEYGEGWQIECPEAARSGLGRLLGRFDVETKRERAAFLRALGLLEVVDAG